MSGAAETLLLEVRADASGFAALQTAFAAATGSIELSLKRLDELVTKLSGIGKSGLGGLTTSSNESTQAIVNLQAQVDKLTQGMDELRANYKKSGAAGVAAAEEVKAANKALAAAQTENLKLQELLFKGTVTDGVRAYKEGLAKQAAADKERLGWLETISKLKRDIALKDAAEQENITKISQARQLELYKAAEAEKLAISKASAAQRLQAHMLQDAPQIARARQSFPEYFPGAPKLQQATTDTRALAEANRELHAAARGASGGLGQLWLTYGSVAPLVAAAALTAGLAAVVTQGKQFEYTMAFVQGITGSTTKEMDKLSASLIALSKNNLFSPLEAAEGLRQLAQAGLGANAALSALPATLQLATVGEMSVAAAAVTLTGVMNAFGLNTSKIGYIGDIFAKAAAISTTSVAQMTESMKSASVVAEQFKVSIEDTAAALVILAQRNITGSAAGTSFRNFISEMAAPTSKGAKAMKELGISAYDSEKNLKSLTEQGKDLRVMLERFDRPSQNNILKELFNERGAKFAAALVSSITTLPGILEDLSNSTGFLAQANERLTNSVKGQLTLAYNEFSVQFIKAFQASSGALGDFAFKLRHAIQDSGLAETLLTIGGALLQLTTFLIENHKAILLIGGAYVTLKVVLAGLTVLGGIATSLGLVSTAAAVLAPVLGAVEVAALTATPAIVATGAAAGVTAASIGAVLGPIILVTGGLYLLWRAMQQGDSTTDLAIKKSQEYTNQLDEENKRLSERIVLYKLGKNPDADGKSSLGTKHSENLNKEIDDIDVRIKNMKAQDEPSEGFASLAGVVNQVADVNKELERLGKERLRVVGKLAAAENSEALNRYKVREERKEADIFQAKELERTLAQIKQGTGVRNAIKDKKDPEIDKLRKAELADEVSSIEQIRKVKDSAYKIELSDLGALHKAKLIKDDFFNAETLRLKVQQANSSAAAYKEEALSYTIESQKIGLAASEKQKLLTKAAEKTTASEIAAAEASKTLQDEYAKQALKFTGPAETDLHAATAAVDKTKEQIATLKSQNDLLKDSQTIIIDLAIARQQEAAAKIDSAIATNIANKGSQEELDFLTRTAAQIRETITALKEKADFQKGLVVEKANIQHDQDAPAKFAKDWMDAANQIESAMSSAFGNVGGAIGKTLQAMGGLFEAQVKINAEKKKDISLADNIPAKIEAANLKAANATATAQIKNYGDMAAAAKGFFKEGSTGYKVMESVEKGARLLQLAETVKKFATELGLIGTVTAAKVAGDAEVTASALTSAATQTTAAATTGQASATAGVANQAGGDPYTAFFRMAAMMALMGALGFAVSGGGAANVDTTAIDRQKAQGAGSVLGDSSAKSESITKALAMLADKSIIGNQHTAAMLRALQSIDNSMGSLASLVARSANVQGNANDALAAAGGRGGSSGTNVAVGAAAGAAIGTAIMPVFGTVIGAVIGGILGALTRTTRSITDSGISFASQTVQQARQGVNAAGYSDVQSRSTFLGISMGSSNNRVSNPLSSEITNQFTQVINNLFNSILGAARVFGSDVKGVTDILNAFHVNIGNISLKDLKGDALQKVLTDIFSKLGDDMANAAFPGLAAFQKVGEGTFETLARLAQEFSATNYLLELMGKDTATAFGAVGFASIGARDDLVQLMGGLKQMSTDVSKYIDLYYSEGDKALIAAKGLATTFEGLNIALPQTVEEYKALINAQDLSTHEGREMYANLIANAEAFHQVSDAIDNLKKNLADLKSSAYDFRMSNAQRINNLGGNINIGAIAQQRATELLPGNTTGTAQQRIDNINKYVGVIDQWVSAQTAKLNKDAAAQSAANAAMAAAQKSAIDAQVAGLQKQLQLAQSWASVMQTAQKALDSLRLTASSPAPILSRLDSASSDTKGLLGAYRNATGQARIDLANQLMTSVGTKQNLGQDALQRPSDQYMKLYNENIAIYSEIKDDAKTQADQVLSLTQQIANLTAQSAGFSAQTSANTGATSAAVNALNEEARALYEEAGKQYDIAAAQQELVLSSQLAELKILNQQVSKLPTKEDVVVPMNQNIVSKVPVVVNIAGRNFDAAVLTTITRNGRVIKQTVEQS